MDADRLAAVTRCARGAFAAGSASIALLDERTDELVFHAVSGDDVEELLGGRYPAATGIAGAVLRDGEPMYVADVGADPRFAADIATETGYAPECIWAVPLVVGGSVAGVLSILDPGLDLPDGHALLGAIAQQAVLALGR